MTTDEDTRTHADALLAAVWAQHNVTLAVGDR